MKKEKRGFYGIAFYEPKFVENIGTAIRSAHCFGVDFIAIIGARYKKQPSDTMATERHIPIYEYEDLEDFLKHKPLDCEVIAIECDGEENLESFAHPERCIYLFGGEDRNVPKEIKSRIKFETSHCVNMAIAASITIYDRHLKSLTPK